MTQIAHPDSILIIDFGSQVTQLIARRIREAGVYCEIHPFQNAAAAFEKLHPKGVIFSGGPASVTTEGSPRAPQAVFDSGVPILGICYGHRRWRPSSAVSSKAGTRLNSAAPTWRSRQGARCSRGSGKSAAGIRSG